MFLKYVLLPIGARNSKYSIKAARSTAIPGRFSVINFNALPDSPQISSLPADWMDPFDGSIFGVDSYTCCIDILTQQSARLTKRIDYLFVIPGSMTPQVISANHVFDTPFLTDEGWIFASDHVGLVADFGAYP